MGNRFEVGQVFGPGNDNFGSGFETERERAAFDEIDKQIQRESDLFIASGDFEQASLVAKNIRADIEANKSVLLRQDYEILLDKVDKFEERARNFANKNKIAS